MPWTCIVPTCDSNKSKKIDTNVSTFKVPDQATEKELHKRWFAAIPGCKFLRKNHRICIKHFDKDQIISERVSKDRDGNVISVIPFKHPRLVKGAIPCRFSNYPSENLERFYNEQVSETNNSNSSDVTSTEQPVTDAASIEISTPDENVVNSNTLSRLCHDDILNWSAATAIFQSVTFDFDGKVAASNSSNRVKLIIDLIKPWNAARAVFANEECLVLSHIVETVVSGKKNHILEKSVLITKDRKIIYEVFGRPCDVDKYELPNFLEKATKLTEILKRFKDLPICSGVKISNFNCLIRTFEQPWRPDNCTLISLNREICPACQKQTKFLSTLKSRKKKIAKLQRITSLSNPLDHKKLDAIQNKMKDQDRQQSILRRRLSLLEKKVAKSK